MILFGLIMLLIIRVGWIAIVDGDDYSERALEQQTRDKTIEAKRGTIYDTNGKEMAVSVTCYTVWARPNDVKNYEKKKDAQANIKKIKTTLSKELDLDESEIEADITKKQNLVKIKSGINKNTVDKIRKAGLRGIEIAEDTERSYPMGAFASHVLGTVSSDNTGLSGFL